MDGVLESMRVAIQLLLYSALAAVCCVPTRSARAAAPAGDETAVNFSFDQVEIRILTKLVGDITGKKFVVSPEVKGKVTVVTPSRVPVRSVYPLFVSIIESSGYSVAERQGTYHIVPIAPAQVTGAPVYTPEQTMPAAGILTRVFRLEHVDAGQLRAALAPLIRGGATGAVTAFEPTNHLIVTDTAESLRRVQQIIAEIDKPGLASATEILALRHAAAEDVAAQLNAAIAGTESRARQLARRMPQPQQRTGALAAQPVIVPAPHSNSLILVGPPAKISDLKQIVQRLDVEPPSGQGRLTAIFLHYLSAEQAAKSLNALLAKSGDESKRQRIAIEADVANNALIVDAAPRDLEQVRTLVAKLDQPPQQVLVEVMIAELSLEDGLDVGLDLFAGGAPAQGETEVIGSMQLNDGNNALVQGIMQGVIPNGFTIGLAHGSYTDADGNVIPRWPALLNLRATKHDSRVRILSSIPLWAQNNHEASVNIVKNIPILKSTVQGGSGSARDVIQNIERIDVGIKLTLTPHVNPDGEVLLNLNPNIEAIISPASQGESLTPSIVRREVSTTVTVPDGATVVISGLIREDQVKQLRKVPILGSIPLLGIPFRHYVDVVERTNLLIFVAPHVVSDAATAAAFREALQRRTSLSAEAVTNLSTTVPKP